SCRPPHNPVRIAAVLHQRQHLAPRRRAWGGPTNVRPVMLPNELVEADAAGGDLVAHADGGDERRRLKIGAKPLGMALRREINGPSRRVIKVTVANAPTGEILVANESL